MGINRFDKAPEWQPWTLPYDLILKAADMTQQRWDKGVADSDKIADDLFKSVKTIPGSVDETANLPAVRDEYNQLKNSLLNDPDINPTKFTSQIQQFASRNKPILDRMTNLASLYDVNMATVNANESNVDWRAKNEYLPGSHIDPSRVDSRDDKTPYERLLNSRGTTNFTPFISDNFLKGWTPSNDVVTDPTTGQVISVGGKSIEDLELKAETNTPAYMQTGNFMDYVNSGKLDNMIPDEALSGYGKSFFGGKYFGELDVDQKAKAMIMMAGATQINQKESMTVARKGNGNDSTEDAALADPYVILMNASTVSGKDVAAALGAAYNENTGTMRYTLPKGTISTLGISNADPDREVNAGLVTATKSLLTASGINNDLQNIYNINESINKQEVKGFTGSGDPKFTVGDDKASKLAVENLEKQKKEAILKLGKSLEAMSKTPKYLELVDILAFNGYNINSPKDVGISLAAMADKEKAYKKLEQGSPKQAAVREAITKSFFNNQSVQDIFIGDANNVTDLGNTKVVRGSVVLGTQAQVEQYLEAANEDLLDIKGAGWNGDTNNFSGDLYNSFEEMIVDNPNMFVEAGIDKEGNQLWGVNIHLPMDYYDTNKHRSYDKAVMTGDNSDNALQTNMNNAATNYIVDRMTRTTKLFADNPTIINTYKTALISVISTYPEGVKKEITAKLKDPDLNVQEFAYLYQAVVTFGSNYKGFLKHFEDVNTQSVNPTRPQGQANPLGGIKP